MKCGYFPKIIMEIFMFTISSFQSGITITQRVMVTVKGTRGRQGERHAI